MVKGQKYIQIDWAPDKASNLPVYKQIVEYVSKKVSSGDWAVGSRFCSQRDLAEALGVNRSTIVAAMEELASYGMIEASYGGGTKISGNTWAVLMSSPPDWNKYIGSGPFIENINTIQTINRLEYDPKYIRLGTGELSPALFPKDIMKKICESLPHKIDSLNYLGPLGLPQLQETLARKLNQRGISVKPSNILITSGSLQALQLVSVCMLKPGSTVFTEAPTYLKSLQMFQSAGMDLHGIPMDSNGLMYWKIKKELKGSILYTIPTFHNPTGVVMSEERRRDILEFCCANQIPMIEDDAYGELWLDDEPPLPIKTLDISGTVLYTGTISKVLAPGLRVGWLVGPESVVNRLGDVKMQMDYGASSISQWMLNELLQAGGYDEYLKVLRKELKERRAIALSALEESFSDIALWDTPRGGFYIWLRINKNVSGDKLFRRALEKKLLINPGNIYDYKENSSIRLSYAYADKKDLRDSIKRLSDVIKKL